MVFVKNGGRRKKRFLYGEMKLILYNFSAAMQPMKKILLFIMMLCFSAILCAKDKHRNSVKIYGSNFFYPGITPNSHIIRAISPNLFMNVWAQVGVGYERYLNSKFSVEAAYSRWNNTNYFRGADLRKAVFTDFNNTPQKIGMHSRGNLQFYDLSLAYTFLSKKRHGLKGGIALSFQTGHTGYIDSIRHYTGASFPHFEGFEHFEYKEYWGYAPSVSYNFSFLKDYACVGADVRARRYFGAETYTQVDVGIHIGVKFGDPHFRKMKKNNQKVNP
jgi:hypothetical protein